MDQPKKASPFESFNNWVKRSVTLKLMAIGVLTLLLLIPLAFIQSLIDERQAIRQESVWEVSSLWAEAQSINGPILSVPISRLEKRGEDLKTIYKTAHFLPENLQIEAEVVPKTLQRGIYQIPVYTAHLTVEGSFSKLAAQLSELEGFTVDWKSAFLTVGLHDLRGISSFEGINWNGQMLPLQPGSKLNDNLATGVTVALPKNFGDSIAREHRFSFSAVIKGSQQIGFTPVGKVTEVRLSSAWPDPSFNGSFLPQEREVTEEGFTANWKILQVNRNFPQQWIGQETIRLLNTANFGLELYQPLDDYQKATRSAKYALLPITLTFLVFFLVEIMNKKRIHPFQYTLVGLALCLFYILLISISEHSTFNVAYLAASLVVLLMIGLYSRTVFKEVKLSLLLGLIMAATYGFIFVTLQLTDYALLIGSLGLTAVLALTMYFTRNINWYAA